MGGEQAQNWAAKALNNISPRSIFSSTETLLTFFVTGCLTLDEVGGSICCLGGAAAIRDDGDDEWVLASSSLSLVAATSIDISGF